MIKQLGVSLGAATVLSLGGGIAANAATTAAPITGAVQVTNHRDTTNVTGPGTTCTSTPDGNVWAYDAFTANLSAVQGAVAGTWNVTVQLSSGSFAGFADPTTCAALTSAGDLTGNYTATVTSATPPAPSNLPKSDSSKTDGIGVLVTDFFGANSGAVIATSNYSFQYQGGKYIQDGDGYISGDVVATTSPSPSPTPTKSQSPSPKPSSTGSSAPTKTTTSPSGGGSSAGGTPGQPSSGNYPTGGVETGGGKPVSNPWLPIGLGLAGLGSLSLAGGAVALRKRG